VKGRSSTAAPEPHDRQHRRHVPPIEAIDLSAGYNGELAIEGLSFCLEPGNRVAVVGPNGAGKTTLFKLIAGILRPTSGQLVVHGHQPGQHLCVAYVPQRSEVDWRFPATVEEVVMMGRIRQIGLLRWPLAADWRAVRQALEQVGMLAVRQRQIGELSGGQQQRVFLAQAVAQQPEIVLLDEPLSGLDVPSQAAILDILDDLEVAGVTVLVATHDLNLAAERFEQVLLLNRQLVAEGEPVKVLTEANLLKAYAGSVHLVGEHGRPLIADAHQEPGE